MKKLLTILGVITCMVGLCACGEEEKIAGPFTDEELIQIGERDVMVIDTIVSQGAIEQYAGDPVVYAALNGWADALDEIGTFEGTNGAEVDISEEEIVINVNILGSDHDAVMEIIFDSEMTAPMGMTTNIVYSTGEIMMKALMNTVIGMGTVFVVLIIISLIISCFGFIPKIQAKFQKKPEAPAAPSNVQADPVVTQIAEKEELSDDTELVAVIAAAIAAYEGSGSTDGFVVRSIRKSSKSKWQNA